ncbi:pseudouridine synthase [Odoribacter sp. Z80]|uniref:pseudouridine synthase n=1 Tax=Odoribacter sp. Z80 TaxID=2304575 RepID=UPI00137B6879|nr:pseudouridine synthase [Odoribacter sp. Z80]NCE71314.1 rRNA pseudouridine synthase [Odoribacter sp. Z80]
MERDYSRNKFSYRPRKNDSREDYRASRTDRRERIAGGERNERRGVTDRREYTSGERHGRGAEGVRNFSREDSNCYPRSRENKPFPDRFRPREEREKRPRIFTRGEKNMPQRGEEKHFYKRNEEKPYVSARKQRPISDVDKEELRQKHYSKKKVLQHRLKREDENTELRLNRYISMGGVCSRRDADELILSGRVKVNGTVVQTVGIKVSKKDAVEVDDVRIFPERKVYLVLNKPKDYVTTVEDPLERKTVMSLIEGACKERIYPVGRLDRQTTGVLLFTNDGDLAKKLTHPKYDHKKIYHVFLDKPLMEKDLEAIATGIDLEDGFIKADEISYTSPDCTEVGIEIHSGKNRIVRRIFEHLGYEIVKLDRVYFAGITKKNILRGRWRFLNAREVNMLKVY